MGKARAGQVDVREQGLLQPGEDEGGSREGDALALGNVKSLYQKADVSSPAGGRVTVDDHADARSTMTRNVARSMSSVPLHARRCEPPGRVRGTFLARP